MHTNPDKEHKCFHDLGAPFNFVDVLIKWTPGVADDQIRQSRSCSFIRSEQMSCASSSCAASYSTKNTRSTCGLHLIAMDPTSNEYSSEAFRRCWPERRAQKPEERGARRTRSEQAPLRSVHGTELPLRQNYR